ncbi:selenocysteine-specific translation elongation factor [Aggregicoccus sp. 17bor-14]|uniref:selenocysteine-specific translation elongation factor n=1 Tax=Myxococcaceae TaxID=31 RepID=UPI00129C1964|nr:MULTISPECIES: selenocysteine-specific translation elongation factor [Myxococcaceae]MBF5045052.1 selenocysteine-specific translation elongation factor [Simulacricoccus sp. 17bor-14]MRI90794.1 selenocysteine-specific translation elongation factor [Aggregicoccus sp. 17bor-14]
MIIGTAGHVDHGKTALVKALTGVDTDRLPEEKRRGITLELGFAQLRLPDGRLAGVVDVPGHERFVRAMAAGAGGVDLALFVVAADEGVMPQTREHLDICRLLGVQAGVVALTKSDLLPELGEEWLALLRADLAELTRGSFLESAPVLPVSARTGEGLDALREALGRAAAHPGARPAEGPVFLPVDRAFSLKGFGTVVTGTLLSGTLAAEDAAALLPGLGGPFRVRGLQQHGAAQARVAAGSRVAVNLAGVEPQQVRRGMVLTREGELPEVRTLDVELTALAALERPLPRRQKLLLHLGTAQVQASVALLDLPQLAPGETGLAQLRLEEPLAALVGQRFILRAARALPGRGATVAGGRVLAVGTPRRRRGASALLAPLQAGDAGSQLQWLLEQAGYRGLTQAELFGRSGLAPRTLARTLELLGARGAAVLVDRERRLYLAGAVLHALQARALALLERFHQEAPAAEGLPKEELRQRLSDALDPRAFARVLAALQEGGRVELAHERLRLPGQGGRLSGDEAGVQARALERFRAAQLAPPTLAELAAALGQPGPRLLPLLLQLAGTGALVRVSEELFFDAAALAALRERLVAHLREKKDISTQAFKEMVGQTRKYVIPLSEYFDREKVTLRVGDKRVLRRG